MSVLWLWEGRLSGSSGGTNEKAVVADLGLPMTDSSSTWPYMGFCKIKVRHFMRTQKDNLHDFSKNIEVGLKTDVKTMMRWECSLCTPAKKKRVKKNNKELIGHLNKSPL